MKCPNCGAEMPAGSLYCEQCGEDIHIVPDFEPEVELNIEQTLSEIVEDIKVESGESESIKDSELAGESDTVFFKKLNRLHHIFLLIIVSVLCVIIVVAGTRTYQYNSLEYQLEKAGQCVEKEEYDRAIGYYTRALEISDNDVVIMFKLAEVYFLKNNKIEYEYLLREIVADSNATSEQITSAYGKLIAIYRAREDFESINELLMASENEEVMHTYQDYVAMPPEFSIQEGYYTDIQPLKITAYGTGTIYYTLDGTEPDENSPKYITPIILEAGTYVVKAYFVNGYGISSEVVTKQYQVEIDELPKPKVDTVSGDYSSPTYVEISDHAEDVYYTTDGTEPTISSNVYKGPIPMPLGKSNFKFIRIEGGRKSAVVERSYNLVLQTDYTPEDAVKDIVAYAIKSGKIYHEDGYAVGVNEIYTYQYQYTAKFDSADYYVISEFVEDAEGVKAKTGNYYAVEAYYGKLFKLQIDEANNYTLVEIEEQP
uniref:chitobiase/beta-hexosaminidase C-terminal domain-containing protein n=1 Tax=Acetatifactor sp. TaxID=1872090 RepID=UPI0040561355